LRPAPEFAKVSSMTKRIKQKSQSKWPPILLEAVDIVFSPNCTVGRVRITPWPVDSYKNNFQTSPVLHQSTELWDLCMNLKKLNYDTKRLPGNCMARV